MDKLIFKMDGNVRAMLADFIEMFSFWEVCTLGDEFEPEAIEHNSRDGFIPFTNGGYRVSAMDDLGGADGRGMSAVEEKYLRGYVDSAQDDSAYEFINFRDELKALREDERFKYGSGKNGALLFEYFDKCETDYDNRYKNPNAPEFECMEKVPAFWSTPGGIIREEFYEFEYEGMCEGCNFFWEVRAHYYSADNSRSESGQDEIYFLCGINTDLEYGRDKGLNICAHETVKVSELTSAKLCQLRDWFESALQDDTSEPEPLADYAQDERFKNLEVENNG